MTTTSPPSKSPVHPLLRHRNTTAAATKLSNSSSTIFSSSSSFPSDDLELLPIKPAAIHSYSSLRDILPSIAAINSPKPKSGPDVSIRNRLVKQAAKAYLRPMPTSSGSTGGVFRRFWRCLADVVDFLCRSVIQVTDGTLGVIGLRSSELQRAIMCLV